MPKVAKSDGLEKARKALRVFVETKPKATLRSMKEIVAAFSGIPSRIADEEGNLDFDKIGSIITIGVRQIDYTVTADEVETVVDLDNLQEALVAATNFMTMTVPEGVVPDLTGDEEETPDSVDPLGESEKN